jgi:type IV fimbrial biogenesis protein FimT
MNGELHPCRPARASRASGFTLIELMVTISIAAILAMLAAPSFKDFVIRNRSAALTNEFVGSTLRARTEAVSRNMCMSMCRSTNASGAAPSCAGQGTSWEGGWIIFRNPGCDPTVTTPAADELLLANTPANPDYSLTAPTNAGLIFFSPTGNPRPTDAGAYLVRYQATTRTSNRSICLSALGRTLTTTYGATCPN